MKALSRMVMMFAVISAIVLTSCSKDDDTPDMTATATGEYQGTYKEGESGSTISVDEVDATITTIRFPSMPSRAASSSAA